MKKHLLTLAFISVLSTGVAVADTPTVTIQPQSARPPSAAITTTVPVRNSTVNVTTTVTGPVTRPSVTNVGVGITTPVSKGVTVNAGGTINTRGNPSPNVTGGIVIHR